ncbi:MAG: prepilin-type N-terminal cleavage/methylation domain-containing protein [Aquificota bacterium]|nr:prepilin-type N-terminal cleavage/methylation domain-containing protein [Aquificota bacterium]
MSGRSEGFTLLEVVIALSVIAVAFTTLIEVLSYLGKEVERSEKTLSDLIALDRKVKEGDLQGLSVERVEVPDYPVVRGVVYRKGELFLIRYERK